MRSNRTEYADTLQAEQAAKEAELSYIADLEDRIAVLEKAHESQENSYSALSRKYYSLLSHIRQTWDQDFDEDTYRSDHIL